MLEERWQDALKSFDRAIRLDPQLVKAYVKRGNAYDELGQPERAIEDYNEAIRLDPQYAEAYNNRGIACRRLVQHERAIDDYSEAIRINPQYTGRPTTTGASRTVGWASMSGL